MGNDLLTHFSQWFVTQCQWLTAQGLVASLSEPSHTDKPAQYADVDGNGMMGRVTLWVSGECDTEALDVESGNSLFWKHEQVNSPADLNAILNQFIQDLLNGAA